jgi:hypothetical protein
MGAENMQKMNSPWLKIGWIAIFLCALHPALSQGTPRPTAPQAASAPAAAPNRTPVIVELYTSEGCSSCPPADDYLAQLEQKQPLPTVEIVALEEHVDYFNQEGWIDPFSSKEWTQRQESYDSALRAGGPVTPQMIVDGANQFAGSEINHVGMAILQASRQPRTGVMLSRKPSSTNDAPHFDLTVGKLVGVTEKDAPEIWLVISESGLHSAVDKGENAGHDLHHASVVRTIRKIGVANPAQDSTSFTGDFAVEMKPAWKPENLSAVVVVQEKKSRRILGAAAIPIAK